LIYEQSNCGSEHRYVSPFIAVKICGKRDISRDTEAELRYASSAGVLNEPRRGTGAKKGSVGSSIRCVIGWYRNIPREPKLTRYKSFALTKSCRAAKPHAGSVSKNRKFGSTISIKVAMTINNWQRRDPWCISDLY
jgi:hypothetical protein